jgi:hypothetical protein
MGVFVGSRYQSEPVLQVEDSWGVYHPTVYGPQPFENTSFYHYVVQLGDRFDLLANTYFNDPQQWWRIAAANPEIAYPDINLTPGSVIRIPTS